MAIKDKDKTVKLDSKKAAAVAVSAALLAGGAAAADSQPGYDALSSALSPTPVVQTVDDYTHIQTSDDDKKVSQQQEKSGIAKVILLPLYAAGAVLMRIMDLLFTAVVIPVIPFFVKWLVMAAVVAGVLALCFKTAFPDIPLKKMLTKKGIIFILIATGIISLVCQFLPLVWPDAGIWIFVIRVAGGLAVLLPFFATVIKVFLRRRKRAAA